MYFYSLQILRAIASIEVVAAHSSFGIFHAFGVDIFFILSGFIIAMLIEPKPRVINNNSISHPISINPTHFWLSRYLRVAPAYYFYTLLAATIGVTSSESLLHWFTTFLMIKTPTYTSPVFSIGWTLEYEFALYCLATLSVWFTVRFSSNKHKPLNYLIFLLLLSSFVVDVVLYPSKCYGHFLEFVMGGLSFPLYNRFAKHINSVQLGTALILIGFLGVIIVGNEFEQLKRFRFLFLGLPAFSIFWGSLFLENLIMKKRNLLWMKIILQLGAASFTLYLSHLLVLDIGRNIFGLQRGESLFVEFLLVIIAILLSLPLFNLIEKNITQFCKKFVLVRFTKSTM